MKITECMTCCLVPVAAAILGPCMILLATGLWGCSPRSSGRGEPQQAWMNGRFPVAVKGSPDNAAEVAELEKMGGNAVFGNVSRDVRRALKDKGILYFIPDYPRIESDKSIILCFFGGKPRFWGEKTLSPTEFQWISH